MRPSSTRRRDRGAVIPLVALLLPVIMVMTAFAVDLGRQRSDRRTAQAVADVVALDMSRLADGRDIATITTGDAIQPPSETALQQSAARNGVSRSQLELDWGTFDEATGTYKSLNMDPAGVPDAVRIVARDTTDYYFQPGRGDVVREAVARNGNDPIAGFKVGSFGAALDTAQSRLLSALISPILGNPATLTAVGYQGLVGASVDLLDLGAELGLLTPEELLHEEVSLSDVMLASATLLRQDGKDAQAAILEGALTTQTDGLLFRLGDVVEADGGSATSGANVGVDVLDMIQAAATTSTCSPNPAGFADCTGLAVPNLQTPLPVLPASTAGVVKVIQGPQYHVGPVGTGVDTGQVQLALNATLGSQAWGKCVPSLANGLCIVGGLLVGAVDATVRVDGLVELFGGRNTIDAISCQDPAVQGFDVGSNTEAYQLRLTVKVEFGRRGLLGGALGPTLGTLQFTLGTDAADSTETVPFLVPPDVLGETVKRTSSSSAGLSGLSVMNVSGNGVLGLLGSLGIATTVDSVLTRLVNPLVQTIDTQWVSPLTHMLGLNVTGSDLTPTTIDCQFGKVQLVG